MKKKICITVITIALGIPHILQAAPFKIIGTRPVGMGGAYVAISEGAIAQYWNPAGLVTGDTFDLQTSADVTGEFTKNLLQKADDVSKLAKDIESLQAKTGTDAFNLKDYEKISLALKNMSDLNEDGLGALLGGNLGVNLRYLKYAFSFNAYLDASADPFVDLENVGFVDASGATAAANIVASIGDTADPPPSVASAQTVSDMAAVIEGASTRLGLDLGALTPAMAANALINQAAAQGVSPADIEFTVATAKEKWDVVSEVLPPIQPLSSNSFDNNETNLTLRGGLVREFAFGTGFKIPSANDWISSIAVGINLKVMTGEVGFTKILITKDNVDIKNIYNDITNNSKTTTRFTGDLGIMLDRKKKNRFKIGLVGKNLTSPSFDAPDGGASQDFNAQFRLGTAYWIFDRWVVATDLDLTNNETSLPGFNSRNFGLGTEIKAFKSKIFNLILRAGWMKNIAESSSSGTYTAGLGLTLFHFTLDAAGGISTDRVAIDNGNKIPKRAFVSVMASLNW